MIISESNLQLENQTFGGNLSAKMLHPDGRPYHTFRTSSLLLDGNHIRLSNCWIENTAGPGEKVGQAIALYLDGADICLEDCVISGHQDTLFLAPLPEKEIEKDGFLGPKQFCPRTPRLFRFRHCLIEGGVDFVFGGATAYFEECVFRSVEPGYVFAPSTPKGQAEGFVAKNCRFTYGEGVKKHSCFLGRPWRNYGKVRLEHCFLDSHINPKGWDDWGKTNAHGKFSFVEVDSYGPGYVKTSRVEYVTVVET